jgi:acetylornithine aminotransferase
MAKGMGNGFPVGGILIAPEIEAFPGMLGTTYGGNHLACAASLAVLEVLESENLMQHAQEMGAYLIERLSTHTAIKEIRGKGLMIGFEFSEPVAEMRKKLLYEQFIFTGSSSNPNTIRLLPPLNITQAQIDYFLDGLKQVIQH